MKILDFKPGDIFIQNPEDPWHMLMSASLIEPWESVPEKFHNQVLVICIVSNKKKTLFVDPDTEFQLVNHSIHPTGSVEPKTPKP